MKTALPLNPSVLKNIRPAHVSFDELVVRVAKGTSAWEDCAEAIEDHAYEACEAGRLIATIEKLRTIISFFENMADKNDEQVEDMSDVAVLIGSLYQYANRYSESTEWFEKAIQCNNTCTIAYHGLAVSCIKMGLSEKAAAALEQEITIEPGNYYTYLFLADHYKTLSREEDFKRILQQLLERDPNNLQALHRLIIYYNKTDPQADVDYLRRRLIAAVGRFNKTELLIWTLHMSRLGNISEAIERLESQQKETPEVTIVHLLRAYLYDISRMHTKKRQALSRFKQLNHGNEEVLYHRLEEFKAVFGDTAASSILASLQIAHPE
jgi:tetratricopeptide (TPR) repeat protein